MAKLVRSEAQWGAINRAIEARPDGLTADMYQDAVVAQVLVDTPDTWPLGPIEGVPPSVYMTMGVWEECAETMQPDDINPGYNRMAKLVLPTGVPYLSDEAKASSRHLKEFGDLSWYVANILASYRIRLSDILPGETLQQTDEAARAEAQSHGGLHWHMPGHAYVFSAINFLESMGDMCDKLEPGDVTEFLRRRDNLAQRAGQLLLSVSVVAQTKFGIGLADVLYQNLLKVEARAATGTTLHSSGDEREKVVRQAAPLVQSSGAR